MTQQPDALRLADAMSLAFPGNLGIDKAAAELRRLQAKTEDLEGAVDVLSGVVSERNQLEAQRDALLEVLKLARLMLVAHGESHAKIDDAIKAVEGVKHD